MHYTDLVADPIETVNRIHQHFGKVTSPLHERRIRAWMNRTSPSAAGRHAYDPTDFGWSYATLAEEFADYSGRYGIACD